MTNNIILLPIFFWILKDLFEKNWYSNYPMTDKEMIFLIALFSFILVL